MLYNITSANHLPHEIANNQQTPYDNVRLLKGAPVGQKQVNFYAQELAILRCKKLLTQARYDKHLAGLSAGGYDYHHNVLDMGGITADQKFYDKQKIADYVSAIRFKKADRTVPVLT